MRLGNEEKEADRVKKSRKQDEEGEEEKEEEKGIAKEERRLRNRAKGSCCKRIVRKKGNIHK